MPAYYIVDVREVTDEEKMSRYRERVGASVRSFGGRYIVAGGRFEVIEGDWRPVFPVVVEFPDMERARRWYDSEDYRELKELRLSASKCNLVLVDGR